MIFSINKYALAVLALFVGLNNFAQNADCIEAFPICSNQTLPFDVSDTGLIDEIIEDSNACPVDQNATKWLRFKAATSGTLGFEIDPENENDDYDFAVFGPSLPCTDLGTAIRSSFAFKKGTTGLRSGAGDDCEDAAGDKFVNMMNVVAGEEYFILIDNFTAISGAPVGGFDISWSGTARLDCTIVCSVDLGPNRTVCEGGFVDLNATIEGAESYSWSNGESSPTIRVKDPGNYSVSITRFDDCVATDVVNVEFVPPPIGRDAIFSTCDLGDGEGSFILSLADEVVTLSVGVTISYHEKAASARANTNKISSPYRSEPKTIFARIQSGEDCFVIQRLELVLDAIEFVSEPIVTACFGEILTLPNGKEVIDSGTYSIPENNGCTIRQYPYEFELCEVENYCLPQMPSAFSPNGNGANELLTILNPVGCDIVVHSLAIYNRWGENVMADSQNSYWDGMHNGEQAQNGLYVYVIEYSSAVTSSLVKRAYGGVNLLR